MTSEPLCRNIIIHIISYVPTHPRLAGERAVVVQAIVRMIFFRPVILDPGCSHAWMSVLKRWMTKSCLSLSVVNNIDGHEVENLVSDISITDLRSINNFFASDLPLVLALL